MSPFMVFASNIEKERWLRMQGFEPYDLIDKERVSLGFDLHHDDGPNPGEPDWLAITREFS